jgi:micrococcal nuclease
MTPFVYRGTISAKNYDGDTITCDIDLGFDIWKKNVKIRILGIDTPEMNSNVALVKAKAIKARDRVFSLLPVGAKILLKTEKSDPNDKYGGRYLAAVITADNVSVGDLLIAEGLALPYDGGVKPQQS